jgi:hypothetical protein
VTSIPVPSDEEPEERGVASLDCNRERKLAGIWSLPGGVRRYFETLCEIVVWFEASRTEETGLPNGVRSRDDFVAMLSDRYDATGQTSISSSMNLPVYLGYLVRGSDRTVWLTALGSELASSRDPMAVFDRLVGTYEGVLETLVLVSRLGRAKQVVVFTLLGPLLGKSLSLATLMGPPSRQPHGAR